MDVLKAYLPELVPWLGFFLLAVVLDALAGAGIALYRGEFKLEKFPDFLTTAALYFLGWIIAEAIGLAAPVFGIAPEGWGQVFADYGPKAVYAVFVVGKYGASLVGHLRVIMDLPPAVLYLIDQRAARAEQATKAAKAAKA